MESLVQRHQTNPSPRCFQRENRRICGQDGTASTEPPPAPARAAAAGGCKRPRFLHWNCGAESFRQRRHSPLSLTAHLQPQRRWPRPRRRSVPGQTPRTELTALPEAAPAGHTHPGPGVGPRATRTRGTGRSRGADQRPPLPPPPPARMRGAAAVSSGGGTSGSRRGPALPVPRRPPAPEAAAPAAGGEEAAPGPALPGPTERAAAKPVSAEACGVLALAPRRVSQRGDAGPGSGVPARYRPAAGPAALQGRPAG